MNAHAWRRLAPLVVAALVVGMLAAAPTPAFAAKAVTRIVAAKSVTVNRSTPGVNPWPKALTVKLQKRITSTHYHALSGTIKLYRYDPVQRAYKYVTKKTGSTVTFKLPGRGKYKLYYAGTTSTRSATAYTKVYETVGLAISAPVIAIEPIPATTQSMLSVTYRINWNKEAVPRVILVHQSAFWEGETDGSWIWFEHRCDTTGTVEFNHKVENSEIMDNLWSWRWSYVEPDLRGDYVKTPAGVESNYDVP